MVTYYIGQMTSSAWCRPAIPKK